MWVRPAERTCSKVWTTPAGLTEQETETQSWLWTMGLLQWEKLPVTHKSSLGSGVRAKQASWIVPSLTSPPQTAPHAAMRVALPWWTLMASPPCNLTGAPRQRNMAQMTEQSKTSKRQLRDKEIANLSDGEFKALVIKMLTDLIERGQKMKEQMKDT